MKIRRHKHIGCKIVALGLLILCVGSFPYARELYSNVEDTEENVSYNQISESDMEEEYQLSERYIYGTLNKDGKTAYRYILNGIANFEPQIRIPVSEEYVDKAWRDVRRDFGEIYWVNGYQYCCKDGYVLFQPVYTYSKTEAETYSSLISDKVHEISQRIPANASDYEKVKYVYEYLSENITYTSDIKESQSPVELFMDQKAMCWGYSAAAQCIFHEMGIKSAIVTGLTDENESHAWNVVRIDGSWYYFDATFASTREDKSQGLEYKYMAMNDTIANTEHFADSTYALPNCNSLSSNFYAMEGLLFTGTDRQSLIDWLQKKYSDGTDSLVVMYENQAVSRLIDEGFFEDLAQAIGERQFVEQTDLNYQRMVFIFR